MKDRSGARLEPPYQTGSPLVVSPIRADATQETRSPNFEVVLLGGVPIREPMMQHGPFVMNARAELVRAFEDFRAGRLGTVPGEV